MYACSTPLSVRSWPTAQLQMHLGVEGGLLPLHQSAFRQPMTNGETKQPCMCYHQMMREAVMHASCKVHSAHVLHSAALLKQSKDPQRVRGAASSCFGLLVSSYL